MSDFQNNLPAEQQDRQLIPVLPLRDVVVYPHMVIPLFVGREKSILALEAAMADNKNILLLARPFCRCSSCLTVRLKCW